MLELRFPHEPRIRFAFSPLWETVAWLRSLEEGDFSQVTEGVRAASAGAASRADLAIFADLVRGGDLVIPGFLIPPPTRVGSWHFEDELDRISRTPLDEVRQQLTEAAAARKDGEPRLAASPDEAGQVLDNVLHSFEAYWTHGFGPMWSRHREVMEADVLVHSRRLAFEGGMAAVTDGLNPRIAGSDRSVLIRCDEVDVRCDSESSELVLVPSVRCWPKTFLDPGSCGTCAVMYYPARGAGRPREQPGSGRDDRLARLLGDTRAWILRRLRDPCTTTLLADQRGLTPSAVSQQLSLLHGADLVRRTRLGRRVYYQWTDRGEHLVRLFSD